MTTVPVKKTNQTALRRQGSLHSSAANLERLTAGEENTLEYRIKAVEKDGVAKGKKEVSLWHDITLVHVDPATDRPTPYLNFVCEIPKFSRSTWSLYVFNYEHNHRKKYEIATDEVGNPIKQDEKRGTLREFKKGDIFFNYGCFPRTWEDPTFYHPDAEGCRGDNDPVDVCDIGMRIRQPGEISPLKVLGILCVIEAGEADWKVVGIDAEDKWAPFLNDINDVDKYLPGQLDAIREWFRTYNVADGKPQNVFGLRERFMDKAYALEVIKESNRAWKDLITGEKERVINNSEDEGVRKLVRKLSKSNLLHLAPASKDGPPIF